MDWRKRRSSVKALSITLLRWCRSGASGNRMRLERPRCFLPRRTPVLWREQNSSSTAARRRCDLAAAAGVAKTPLATKGTKVREGKLDYPRVLSCLFDGGYSAFSLIQREMAVTS